MSNQNEVDLRPGTIFKRIYDALRNEKESLCIDGPPEFQRGFIEGFNAAIGTVKSEEGNIACQVTSARSRRIEEAKKDEA